ncbi:hypothetical protein PsorP6_012709 [Peronosclerospora sorghi]|uniref:Uncharacterized protein n=1 Tax=Peronosclerospora sorghi TaxID=230839 RepID=A0ACC0WG59_9STRA|nr:hypothetical protein PsorP6_012709 [Peronosclerospora sorghi]
MAKTAVKDGETREVPIAQLFMTLQEKSDLWYRRERDGLELVENFQSALLSLREAQAMATRKEEGDKTTSRGLSGLAHNTVMDPWLVEDLYEQVQALASGFQPLVEEMYALQAEARKVVMKQDIDEHVQVEATRLRPVDYFQMMSHQVATFEAEYQHLEALVQLMSFDLSTDTLQTLVISWSTSPFLEPEETRRFRQVALKKQLKRLSFLRCPTCF